MNLRSKKVFVAQTGKTGLGLFARRDIRQGEIIFIVKGTLVEDSYNENYEDLPYSLAVEKNLWLDPFDTNPWRYINHSCAPNAGIRGRVTVVAMRDIRGGGRRNHHRLRDHGGRSAVAHGMSLRAAGMPEADRRRAFPAAGVVSAV